MLFILIYLINSCGFAGVHVHGEVRLDLASEDKKLSWVLSGPMESFWI